MIRQYCIYGLLILLTITVNCTGPEGPVGPQGPQGVVGTTGAQGPQGVAGNANVTIYTYGSQTVTSFAEYLIPDMTPARQDSSLILGYLYYAFENIWEAVPGEILLNANHYNTGVYLYQNSDSVSYVLNIYDLNGNGDTGTKVINKFKILVANASSISSAGRVTGPAKDIRNSGVDLKNYYAVCKFYGIDPEN